jgi:LPS sulfotransferase NodH
VLLFVLVILEVSDTCIICAAPRSGTTLLGTAVSSAFDVGYPGEIFLEAEADSIALNDDRAVGPENFFRFRSEAIARNPRLLSPERNLRSELFDLYLDYLHQVLSNQRLLLDIKYTSWHHFNGFWRLPTDPPGLFDLARERNIEIVHVVRRNVFAQYCSLAAAMQTGVWEKEIWKPDGPKIKLRINLDACHRWMVSVSDAQRLFEKWLVGFSVQTLVYEDLLLNGERFSPEVIDVFTRIFGRAPSQKLPVVYKKILPALRDVVEDTEAVIEYFEGTEFGAFVKESLDIVPVRSIQPSLPVAEKGVVQGHGVAD